MCRERICLHFVMNDNMLAWVWFPSKWFVTQCAGESYKFMTECIYLSHRVLFGSKQFVTQSAEEHFSRSCFVITLWMVAQCPVKVAFKANDFSYNVQVKGFRFYGQKYMAGEIVFISKPFVTQCDIILYLKHLVCTLCHKLLGCNGDLNRQIDVDHVLFRFCKSHLPWMGI